LGEGSKQLSWIWSMSGTGFNEIKESNISLCVEWCKARARVHRWQEECMLLEEEMRQVVAFFDWEVDLWKNCGAS
ncbi:hypothetical protein FA15DRAFT_554523, partial [Coprinopsis marcescibilis]